MKNGVQLMLVPVFEVKVFGSKSNDQSIKSIKQQIR